jgi:hypothetical protein
LDPFGYFYERRRLKNKEVDSQKCTLSCSNEVKPSEPKLALYHSNESFGKCCESKSLEIAFLISKILVRN